MDILEIIKALSVLKETDDINYISVRYIDVFGFEVKRSYNKNNLYKVYPYFSFQKVKTFAYIMSSLTEAHEFISLEIRYTNKLGYPCSIYKYK